MEWYYADNSGKKVKFDEAEFPQLVASGAIQTTTLVWTAGMTDWQPASDVRPEQFTAAVGASPYEAPRSPVLHGQLPQGSREDTSYGLQLASMICGILSITCLGILTAIPAVICGHMGRSRKLELTGSKQGTGMALSGLILGYLVIAGTVAYVIFIIVAGMTGAFEEVTQ